MEIEVKAVPEFNWEIFLNVIMLFGVIMIFVSGGIIVNEFYGAKKFCNSVNGKYSFDVYPFPPTHFCNSSPIFKFTNSGWGFDISNLTIDYNKLSNSP